MLWLRTNNILTQEVYFLYSGQRYGFASSPISDGGLPFSSIIRPSVVFLPLIELVLNRFEVAFCRCKFLPAQVIPVIYDLFPCGNEITIKKL
jgi:hypothetical protein